MKISDISPDRAKPIRVETDTDADYIIRTPYHLATYLDRWGNQEIVWDDRFKKYRVPALDSKREAYCRAKASDCAVWGSE